MKRLLLPLILAASGLALIPASTAAAFTGCTAQFKGTVGAGVYCASGSGQYSARVTCRSGTTFVNYAYGPWVTAGNWSAGYCQPGLTATSVYRREVI